MPDVTRESLKHWLAQPEWRFLLDFLREAEHDALQSLTAADPNDPAAVARAQTEVKVLRFFTSGEVADAPIHLLRGEAETGQQLARTGVRRVAVGTVQLNVQTGDSGAVVARFGRSQLALNLAQVLIAVEHVVHGQAFQVVHFLAHMGNAPIGRQQAVASIGPELAAQQGEQAGFAGTVGADETDLLAGVQGQFSAF